MRSSQVESARVERIKEKGEVLKTLVNKEGKGLEEDPKNYLKVKVHSIMLE